MAIFDELKSVASTLQEAGKIEQYRQILDAQKELLQMQKTIFDLEEELKHLKEELKLKDSLIFENNFYWTNNEGKKDGPFCSCCWDSDKKTVRVLPLNQSYSECPKCKNTVQTGPDYNENRVSNNIDEYGVF